MEDDDSPFVSMLLMQQSTEDIKNNISQHFAMDQNITDLNNYQQEMSVAAVHDNMSKNHCLKYLPHYLNLFSFSLRTKFSFETRSERRI